MHQPTSVIQKKNLEEKNIKWQKHHQQQFIILPLRVLASIDNTPIEIMFDSGSGISLITNNRLSTSLVKEKILFECHHIFNAHVKSVGGRVSSFPLLLVEHMIENFQVIISRE